MKSFIFHDTEENLYELIIWWSQLTAPAHLMASKNNEMRCFEIESDPLPYQLEMTQGVNPGGVSFRDMEKNFSIELSDGDTVFYDERKMWIEKTVWA